MRLYRSRPTATLASPAAIARRLGMAVVLCLLALPGRADAQLFSTLRWIAAGIDIAGDFAGATTTLGDVFGSKDMGDDHPLYKSGASSPTLQIGATETTFQLVLMQVNDVGEFEDDEIGVLSGLTKVHTAQGMVDAWSWEIKVEAELNAFSNSTLDVTGFVRHVRAPHPARNETAEGSAALSYALTAERNVRQSAVDRDSSKHDVHRGTDTDLLTARLDARMGGVIDDFKLKLDAIHRCPPAARARSLATPAAAAAVSLAQCDPCGGPSCPVPPITTPEPASLALVATGALSLGGAAWRARRRRHLS